MCCLLDHIELAALFVCFDRAYQGTLGQPYSCCQLIVLERLHTFSSGWGRTKCIHEVVFLLQIFSNSCGLFWGWCCVTLGGQVMVQSIWFVVKQLNMSTASLRLNSKSVCQQQVWASLAVANEAQETKKNPNEQSMSQRNTVEPHYSEPLKYEYFAQNELLSHKRPYIITSEIQTSHYSIKQAGFQPVLCKKYRHLHASHARLSSTTAQFNNWTLL